MTAKEKLEILISQHGFISIAEFMQIVSFEYYSSQKIFGQDGDFITSPEISQLFGEIMGAWVAYLKTNFPNLKDAAIVEVGPGKGTLMSDILRSTRDLKDVHHNLEVYLLENSPQLMEIQEESLKEFQVNINWIDNLDQLPKKPIIFIANEFFDALPIHQYIKTSDQWFEKAIRTIDDKLEYSKVSINNMLSIKLSHDYPFAKEGDVIEISPTSINIVSFLSDHIVEYGGVATIIDYGYFSEPRNRISFNSTLQSVKNHKFSDPLENIGTADITAHVDFYNFALTAKAIGCEVAFTTQGNFLLSFGIKERSDVLIKHSLGKEKFAIKAALNRLTSQNEMGDLFKVLIISDRGYV